jgi:hypothetical protein
MWWIMIHVVVVWMMAMATMAMAMMAMAMMAMNSGDGGAVGELLESKWRASGELVESQWRVNGELAEYFSLHVAGFGKKVLLKNPQKLRCDANIAAVVMRVVSFIFRSS